jgi:hypothetical protein
MEEIKILVVILSFILIALNVYVNSLYAKLFGRHLVNTDKRISLIILNTIQVKTPEEKSLVSRCKLFYKILVLLFCVEVSLAAYLIFNAA